MSQYCEAYDIRNELAIGSGADVTSGQWDRALDAMAEECSRLIDAYCNVEDNAFLASGSATRYVDGDGSTQLWLPWPAVSISAVAVEETDGTYTTWTQATDYYRWPYQDDSGLTLNPILRLDVNRKSDGDKSRWTAGQRRVRIAGVWGVSSTVPDLVRRACIIQCANWYKMAMQGWSDTGGSPEFGQLEYPHKLDKSVVELVKRYKRHVI